MSSRLLKICVNSGERSQMVIEAMVVDEIA